ncbi:MAG: spore maturation protein [Candidatus Gastranaerophilaceae bacterium]
MIKNFFDILSMLALPILIMLILVFALFKKVPVYEAFVDGAKDGIDVTLRIIPYLTAIIVAVAMFRASGALDMLTNLLSGVLQKIHLPSEIMPLAIVRSLSGSAALGVFSDIASQNPPNSYVVKLGAVMLGSSETTFYVLSVYFGAVGIKKYRYALVTGLIADVVGIIAAIIVSTIFFL